MTYEETLLHFGIKGMRWGVRRNRVKKAPRLPSDDHIKAKNLKKKRVKEMSNKELQELNQRLQLQKTLKELKKADQSVGQKILDDIVAELTKIAVNEVKNKVTAEFTKKTGVKVPKQKTK